MNDDRPVIIKEAAECGSTEICVKLKGRGVCREGNCLYQIPDTYKSYCYSVYIMLCSW